MGKAPRMSVTAPAPTARFSSRPGKYIVEDFHKWVRETGKPDEWRYHDRTKPPPDQEYEELFEFHIPDRFRTQVGMASCPVCSPEKPKYFHGVLAWFPVEGSLRAIGHECAKGHFGNQLANAARQRRLQKEREDAAQYRLLEWLPKIAEIQNEAQRLAQCARPIDQLRQAMERQATKAACKSLLKAGQTGVLTILESVKIESVDVYGISHIRSSSQIVASYTVSGLDFLKSPRILIEALASNTLGLLASIEARNENEALDFIVNKLSDPDELFRADALVTKAIEEVKSLRTAVENARRFVRPKNLTALSTWSKDRRAAAPLKIDFNPSNPGTFRLKRQNGDWRYLPIPGCLL